MEPEVYCRNETDGNDPIFRSDCKVNRVYPKNNKIIPLVEVWETTYGAYILTDESSYTEEKKDILSFYLFYHQRTNGTTIFIGSDSQRKEFKENYNYPFSCTLLSFQEALDWMPKTFDDKMIVFLDSFYQRQRYNGERFSLQDIPTKSVYLGMFLESTLKNEEIAQASNFVMDYLCSEKGWITNTDYICLTIKAVNMLNKKSDYSKQAFIAIKFGEENNLRIEAIKQGIRNAGYNPMIMSDYETNQWIVPEIFKGIQDSKFVVVDYSIHCDGAYYEAGYAEGKGKPVISLCEKKCMDSEHLHFDVSQKSTVVYENYEELTNRLTKRIEATIENND